MATYSERKAALNDAASRLDSINKQVAQAEALFSQALAILNSMPTDYQIIFDDISADGDAGAVVVFEKSEVTKLTAEFLSAKALIQAKVDALNGV